MLPEFGNFSLILALCLALLQAIMPLWGSYNGKSAWMQLARPLAIGQFTFVLLAYLILTISFINNDFSVLYVAEHSNTSLPLIYRICAVWGAHEGSLLLWILILGIWTVAVCKFSRKLPLEVLARVLSVLGLVSVGFLLFCIATSNPFMRIMGELPLNGADLNPVLQDPGLIGHPPMLYMGYVGFSVAFAFAITALLSGKLDAAWARWSKPWTLVAWMFLTLGITLGSWWAYRELGWGGWWFWDPVENASFMPWLVGTALLHSLIAAEQRNTFKSWTVLLAIFTFSLSLIGTFLVRSGVLNSVHSFATDPQRGLYILIFLCIVIGSALSLYAWRASTLRVTTQFELVSRETFLLINNVLLVVAAATILLGTLYPLAIDALGLGKLSVGPPYFNIVFGTLMLPLLFFMAMAPFTRWKITEAKKLLSSLWLVLLISILLAIILPYIITQQLNGAVIIGLSLAFWIILATLKSVVDKASSFPRRRESSRSQIAMVIAHLGMAVTIIGITLSLSYEIQQDLRMAPGDVATIAGYEFTFINEQDAKGPNYDAVILSIAVSKQGKMLEMLYPEKRVYRASGITMTDAAIAANPWRDLYVSLGDPLDNNAWAMRLYYKPFVRWIWGGAFLMILGGLIALTDRRYRVK